VVNPDYQIRNAIEADVPLLPEIERRAASLYDEVELSNAVDSDITSVAEFQEGQEAGRLWVATDRTGSVVGFALVQMIGGEPHLEELDVLPEHGRKGIGTALVKIACAWVADAGFSNLTLSTFRDVPWNAPFYEKLGFRALKAEELSESLKRLMEAESGRGLPRELRVVMRRTPGA
jgi:GNAT superfamily N-acetyltransferase